MMEQNEKEILDIITRNTMRIAKNNYGEYMLEALFMTKTEFYKVKNYFRKLKKNYHYEK